MNAPMKTQNPHTTRLAAFLAIFIGCLFVISHAGATETGRRSRRVRQPPEHCAIPCPGRVPGCVGRTAR